MALYRKKIIYIDAVRWRGHKLGPTVEPANQPLHMTAVNRVQVKQLPLPDWLKPIQELGADGRVNRGEIRRLGDVLHVGTNTGVETAVPGDWIIRDKYGEIYPVKPETFAHIYELCEDAHG
jgi:hypothetical protein